MELTTMDAQHMATAKDLARIGREVDAMIAETRRVDAMRPRPRMTAMVAGIEMPAIPPAPAPKPRPAAKAPAGAEPRSLRGPMLRRQDFVTSLEGYRQLRKLAQP